MAAFRRFLPLIIVMAIFVSCKKEDSYMNNGIITGLDARACPCCGGIMINFKGETEPYKGDFYLIQNSPSELGIDNNTKFPVYVSVDWKSEGCMVGGTGNLIRVTRFKRR